MTRDATKPPDEDCDHDTFERFGSTNGVYDCADCGGRIIIPEFQWVPMDDGD